MFLEDVFLGSETDIAFLNGFRMRAAFDGADLFPPREAAFIRSMAHRASASSGLSIRPTEPRRSSR
jgi:hypothetical protein